MIFSTAKERQIIEFINLTKNTDMLLNKKASINKRYFADKNGQKLEKEVFLALESCAKGTGFEGTISLISGVSFPDIIINKYFGVEVKSTKDDKWTSIGSSILESTRNHDVERIFLTFGKLGLPTQFLTKPYEKCLSDIVVTHYPRYRIDMKIQESGGKTIFEKMGVDYEKLRRMQNPVPTVSEYYRKNLKQGQKLWWVADNVESVAVPMMAKLWSTLSQEERNDLTIVGYAFFPETVGMNSAEKYQRYALWLATEKGVINTNIRDSFSAGGQYKYTFSDGKEINLPAVFGRVVKYSKQLSEIINNTPEDHLKEYWSVNEIKPDRIAQWTELVLQYAPMRGYLDNSRFKELLFNGNTESS